MFKSLHTRMLLFEKCQSSWGISSAIHTIIVNQISSSWQFPKCVQLPTVWPILVSLLAEVVGLPASFFQKLMKFIVKRQVYENLKTKGTMNSKAAAHAVWLHYFTASHDVFTAASYLKDSESWLIVPKLLHSFIWLTTYIFANTSGYLFKVSALLAVLQKQILRIGIRFGSQGFGSKLIGDPKISFDIKKRTNFAVKNKRLYIHWKKLLGCQTCLFFLCFCSIPESFEERSWSNII